MTELITIGVSGAIAIVLGAILVLLRGWVARSPGSNMKSSNGTEESERLYKVVHEAESKSSEIDELASSGTSSEFDEGSQLESFADRVERRGDS